MIEGGNWKVRSMTSGVWVYLGLKPSWLLFIDSTLWPRGAKHLGAIMKVTWHIMLVEQHDCSVRLQDGGRWRKIFFPWKSLFSSLISAIGRRKVMWGSSTWASISFVVKMLFTAAPRLILFLLIWSSLSEHMNAIPLFCHSFLFIHFSFILSFFLFLLFVQFLFNPFSSYFFKNWMQSSLNFF